MIIVQQVRTKKQQKEFLNFPLELYRGNPYFVPPLYGDEKKLFRKDYVYYDTSEAVYFNAYENGKMVGRISGILQFAANEKWGQKQVRFTRFDSIDSQEVANALFGAVEDWALSKGMDTVVGPLGFNDLEREGLLIEGFEELSTFEEQYNYEYYPRLVENCGYAKDVDWVERQLRVPAQIDEKLERVSTLMMKRYKLRYDDSKTTREFLKRYADKFFNVLDETYEKLYGTVPITEGAKKMLMSNFKLLIDKRFVGVIVDENDEVAAFGVCFPSIAEAVQPSGGKLTPAALVRLLKARNHPRVIDLGLIGVVPKFQSKAIASAMIYQTLMMMKNNHIEYAETNLNLEDNNNIQNQWKAFDARLHKRRRSYKKVLTQPGEEIAQPAE